MPMSDLQLKFDGSSDIMTNIGLKIANISLQLYFEYSLYQGIL